MKANQESSVVTNPTVHELMIQSKVEGEKPIYSTMVMETDISESGSNAIVTAAAAISAHPHAIEGYGIGASSSTSKMKPPPPFLLKIYDIVKNPEIDSIISWNSTGTSFIVWDPHKFAAEVLGKFFRHNNFSSFVCQLNTYGFKKINWDRLEFQNEWFQKGKRRWLNKIKRRNQSNKNVQPLRVMETLGESILFEKKKKLENLMHEHDAVKTKTMKLIEKQKSLVKEMATLEKQAQGILWKRQKIVKYMIQEVVFKKEKETDALKEQSSDGNQSIESSVELLDEGETSERSKEKCLTTQSDIKKASPVVDLGTATHGKEKYTIHGATFPDLGAADYALLEKQLMDDLNFENISEEERTKLEPNLVIALEDLIAGPADWTEFAKEFGSKARNLES